MALLLPLTFLLMIRGASGTEWSVTYNQQETCALEGSTVFMNGSYTLPERLTVNQTFWVIDQAHGELTDLSKNVSYSGRVETLTDKQKHFSLRLSDVMKKDEHEYGFRIITTDEKEKWVGTPGVQLRVTDLHVEAPKEVTEGGTAVLTCRTNCRLTDPTFIWYKNGCPLTTKIIKNNQLHLQRVSSEDAGSYSCAVGGYQHFRSTDQTLRVRYPPKNVSVSISPSGEIMEGSSVTLTCSSDGNPPVKIYIWFKGSTSVEKGDTYNIPNIRSEHSGEYTCQSCNEHGERNSTAVQINVLYPPKNVSVSMSTLSDVVQGNSVTLTCSSEGNPPVKIYTWFKGSTSVGNGDTYNIPNIKSEHSGEYTCQSRNKHGERRSNAVHINVMYPPKNVAVSINPSGEIMEGSSVNLTCSSDANPPVKNYTWFKGGGTSPVGSGQNHSITAEHTGLYSCLAQNEHGAQNGTVMVTVKTQSSSAVWIAVGGASLLFLLITVFICVYRMNKQPKRFFYSEAKQDDVLYTIVTPSRSTPVQPAASADSEAAEVLYSTLKIQGEEVTSTDQQGEPQYINVTFHCTAATGSRTQTVDEPSVIYSTVKVNEIH